MQPSHQTDHNKQSWVDRPGKSKRGKEHASSEYEAEYRNMIYLYAYKLVQDNAAAEQVTSATFNMLWENRLGLTDPGQVTGYLFMAARTLATEILCTRMRARQKQ